MFSTYVCHKYFGGGGGGRGRGRGKEKRSHCGEVRIRKSEENAEYESEVRKGNKQNNWYPCYCYEYVMIDILVIVMSML